MRVSKFLKLNNISFFTFLDILTCVEWLSCEWGNYSFNLNSSLTDSQIILIQKLVDNYDNSKIIKDVEVTGWEKTNIIGFLNQKDIYYEKFYGDYTPFEIEHFVNIEETEAVIAYTNVILFIAYNLEINYSNTVSYFSIRGNNKVKIASNNCTEAKNNLVKYHRNLMQSSLLKQNRVKLVMLIHANMEAYSLFKITAKFFLKRLSPYKATTILLRFRYMNFHKICEFKYQNYLPYKKMIDHKRLSQIDDDIAISSSKSVYSSPHPFRN
jgi:hypothetical protein